MILFLYNLFTRSYPLALRIAGLWNNKANLWINGRKKFPVTAKENENEIIWMHCASLGEFEQGRPLLEVIKNKYPACKIVITFFSPSGYEIQKNYSGADHVFYLPIDSSANAKKFIELINPTLVLWIKYEFWYYYLKELKNKNIATLLISAAFRSEQIFFKWYGSFWRQMLGFFTHLFVQNDHTKSLLEKTDLKNITVSGDTRFDRVIAIAENFKEIDLIKDFCGGSKVIIGGSTWEDDEAVLAHYTKINPSIKFIIAPHEIDKENLADVKKTFAGSIFYSELREENRIQAIGNRQTNCLIIDNIGMLSRLYKYADITYVGGGFGDDGIHNILEAAVYGKPVIFGPEIERNFEAQELIDCGGAIKIDNALALEKTLDKLLNDEFDLRQRGGAAKNFVYSKAGATKKIIEFIQEKRLLTN